MTKSCITNFFDATHERNTSISRVALRSDCNNALPMLVFVVTKNVRDELRISAMLALREGIDIRQGLKPDFC